MFLRYGKEELPLELPRGVQAKELRIKEMPVLEDTVDAVKTALQNPISSPPLREMIKAGEKICLLVNDPTRVARSEVFLPPVLEELKAGGAREKDIFIVFSAGTHRPLEKEEMAALVGKDIAHRIPMFNHDCHDRSELVYMGETSRRTPVYINKRVAKADKRILTGSIVHHFFAGFGGGRKALVPGVAGYETIQANHSMMLEEKAKGGILQGNPVHEDLLEAALRPGGDFLINVALNERKEFLGIFAGHMVEAHLKGCEFVQKVYGVEIGAPADVVIASCGGYPKDINIYQAQKTLENAVHAVKEGGQVILLARCQEGVGSEACERWAERYPCLEDMSRALKADFQIGGHKAYAISKALRKATVFLISDLAPEKARALGFVPAKSLDDTMEIVYNRASREKGESILTYIMPQGSLTVPVYV